MLSFNTFLERKSERRGELLNKWSALLAKPIPLQPKPFAHYGTSLDEDTIRITGSQEFIESVLARLKDLLVFENQDVKLDISFNQTKYGHAGTDYPNYEFKFSAIYRDPYKKIAHGPNLMLYNNPK